MEPLLKVENLVTCFGTKKGMVKAVDGVSFEIEAGKILGIVGESGCGKSVTSLSIMHLLPEQLGKITDGSILFEGRELRTLDEKEMVQIRGNKIAMIFQDPMTSLDPVMTIGKQLEETVLAHEKISRKEARQKSLEMLKKVNIPMPEYRMKEYPHQLSGGMRQRIMIAMGLLCNPALLIADEPTTALDVTIQAQILDLMKKLRDDFNTAIILITHDMGVVADMVDDILVMYAGRVMEQAPSVELFENPCHPYTKALLKSIPRLDQEVDILYSIKGSVPSPYNMPEGCKFCDRCECSMEVCRKKEPELFDVKGHKIRCWLFEKEAKEAAGNESSGRTD
ncbi:MAG: ABC transporter ATP-binding protein [Coprococcus sp.]|nr:ABC transporter ATP-binding protein [Coprococcus sp.]